MMRRGSVAAAVLVMALFPLTTVAGKTQRPDMITFPSKNGDVYFNHQKHAKASGTCRPCHDRKGGKVKGLGKAWAHKVCRGCHESAKTGPTECQGCHHQQKKKMITGKGTR
ncbi:MAG: cytochrome c3 family protein [Geobacter sp.]|nr:cytochrome c3 family protein [Geobacter sp.]